MLIEDELKAIYLNYKIKEVLPFLIKLTPKEKKEAGAVLKKFLDKDWGHNSISMLTALACSNTQDQYESLVPGYYTVPVDLVDQLFQFYTPQWLGNSYSFLRNINYLKVLEWEHKGYLILNDEVCAGLLSESPGSGSTSEEILFTYPQTLDSHIWMLFRYNSDITTLYNGKNWKDIFKSLTSENKIERLRILQSCLDAVSLNFSKEHNIWFLEMFSYLEPGSHEILMFQDSLFSVFHAAQHSLFVPVLKILSPVITETDFKTDDFLNAVTPLADLRVKNILNTLLQTVEKILKNDPKHSEKICLFLLPVFLNNDAALQVKTARIITKYGDPDSHGIMEQLKFYKAFLLSDTAVLLEKFLPENGNNEELPTGRSEEPAVWHLPQPISAIQTLNDFIFFAPRVFTKNDPNDFDLFLDALMRFNTEINADHIVQLEPAFKAALKVKESTGMHHLYATFFIEYGLMKQEKGSPVLHEAKRQFPGLQNWPEKRTPLILKAYHQLLLGAFEILRQGKNLPLLSVPDHTPCWVDLRMLVDKLKIYIDQKTVPVPFDLQRALLRVRKNNLEESEKYARKQLPGDCFKWLEPVFDPEYYKNRYERAYLDGSFSRKQGTRKVYQRNDAEEITQLTVTIENKEISPEASLLDHLFNSYHAAYDHDLIRILYTAPCFSGAVFAKKYNETLSSAVYQYDIRTNTGFLDAWMSLDLPFQPVHYLFLSAAMLNKDKTFSGTAFEAVMYKIVSVDFDIPSLGIMIGEKISLGLAPAKRLTDGLAGFIGLSPGHNRAFEKLMISILTAIDHPVFNLKKILEMYYELLHLNQSETDHAVAAKLKEWQNENNLKKIIIKLKTNERKTL
ncbi:DUF6493 family protein [Chryseobacterium luteum]|uniref:Uncharacterized protein n=1 Tax=Chryseobacterium luteum TaxID=421531 RepID=A0A085ZUE8_9FLAO|nr:DUF6493 family protein [Chryseobacterium luteum]KFF08062.1 hypothetical protein IX38_07865 [Chryseobacterium luteum]